MAISFGWGDKAPYFSNSMTELSFTSFSSVPFNCDSTGALHVAGNSMCSSRIKRSALRAFFNHDLVKGGKITIHHLLAQ